jgi:chromosome segregation ATPase
VSERRPPAEPPGKSADTSAALEAREKKSTEASRALLSAQVAGLEKDAGTLGKAFADLLEQKTRAEGALASVQAEKRALARKLEELDAELSETLVDSARRTTEQRKALEEMAQRAARLEKEVAALNGGQAARAREQASSPDQWSRRIVELEKEKDALANRLSSAESGRNRAVADAAAHQEREAQLTEELTRARTAMSDAAGREGAQRLALEAARQRAEQLEKEAAALVEREAKLSREWEASRSEWSERLRQAESLRTERQTLVTMLVTAERARDRALAEVARLGETHRAELNEQKQLVEQLKSEAAAAVKRQTRQTEAWQAARADLETRIARLEADAVAAAGARTQVPEP